MIQSQAKAQKGSNESNVVIRHNRFQNLMHNKYRFNNRAIKQVQT